MGKSESQMEMVEKQTRPRKKRFSPLRATTLAVILLLSCALVVLTILYASERDKQGNVCITSECIQATARIIQNMDDSVRPCDNFYLFACGGWLRKNVIPESSARYSTFDILRHEMEVILKDILGKPDYGDREAVKKAKMLYRSCINESQIEKRDSEPLLDIMEDIGDWPVAQDTWNTKYESRWRLDAMLPLLNTNFGERPVIDMFVGVDDKDSRKHIIRARDAYLNFMIELGKMLRNARNLSTDAENVERQMVEVLELETDIANISATIKDRHDITILYNKFSLPEIVEQFPLPGFDWQTFLATIMHKVNVTISKNESILVYAPEYLKRLPTILNKYSARTLQNYIVWHFLMESAGWLSSRFKDVQLNFLQALDGTTVEDARWRRCVRYVNQNLNKAVGSLYVREAFAGDSKQMVEVMISQIREVFIEKLAEINWMDQETKSKAQEKAEAIIERIGYPDYILHDDNPKLDDDYAQVSYEEDTYFENILVNNRAAMQKSLMKLRQPVNKEAWVGSTAEVNAFYSPSRNQIVFPAGILQPPFFSKGQPKSLNYGGIGMVIGHEVTHGFDDTGRNFDKEGNMFNWWSNSSAVSFKKESKCMMEQYGNFIWELAGNENLSGVITLGENIADNGGIRQAYEAYMKLSATEGEGQRLPGLSMDHRQLFFLNFAQVWCSSYRPEYASNSIKTNYHCPGKFRVLGVLQNFPAFSEAFECKEGDFMNPKEKCHVW
uniref:membrane metallo-endopeptidase-like 1 isoform X2 n=1 Tax=Myxine glutinosa TaxID=7769 RepID=UPI00358F2340